jgi:hypothetical protein
VAPRIPVLLKGGAKHCLPFSFFGLTLHLPTTHGDERVDYEYETKELQNGGGSGELFNDFIRLHAAGEVYVVLSSLLRGCRFGSRHDEGAHVLR